MLTATLFNSKKTESHLNVHLQYRDKLIMVYPHDGLQYKNESEETAPAQHMTNKSYKG